MTTIDTDNIEIISVSVFISFLVSITMGSVISIFRKPDLSTAEQLEVLETNLKQENTRKDRVRDQKGKIVRSFWLYGVGVFVALIAGLYLTFPSEDILLAVGLIFGVFILYPIIFFLTRKVCKHYLEREFKKSDDLIKKFQKEKKEILETVMEKEPYNKAKEILKKYDPSLLRSHDDAENRKNIEIRENQNLRRRTVNATPTQQPRPTPSREQQANMVMPNLNATMPIRPTSPDVRSPQVFFASPEFARKKTVRPLPGTTNNQTKMDKIVGWVTGTNPEQMYALICRNCCEHNGLSVREEFDFLEWRCAYCHFLHKARKQRQVAPRLPEQRPMTAPRSSSVGSQRSQSSSPKAVRDGRRPSGTSSESSNRNIREDSGTESDQHSESKTDSQNEQAAEEVAAAVEPVEEEVEEKSAPVSEDDENATLEQINTSSDGELNQSDL